MTLGHMRALDSGLAFLASIVAAAPTESHPIATEIRGPGPVVVFESGLGQSREDWNEVARALAPCLTVVTYDRPGIGESPRPEDNAAPVLASAVANNLLAALHLMACLGPTSWSAILLAGSISRLSRATTLMLSPGWCLSMHQVPWNRRASSSRPSRRSPAALKQRNKRASLLPLLACWAVRLCRALRLSSSPPPTTVTHPSARPVARRPAAHGSVIAERQARGC
jgi:pimeloyl-ACP methyl ester carboxylesterase